MPVDAPPGLPSFDALLPGSEAALKNPVPVPADPCFLITHRCDGDMDDYGMFARTRFEHNGVMTCFLPVLQALDTNLDEAAYCVEEGFVLWDLSPQNVLFSLDEMGGQIHTYFSDPESVTSWDIDHNNCDKTLINFNAEFAYKSFQTFFRGDRGFFSSKSEDEENHL